MTNENVNARILDVEKGKQKGLWIVIDRPNGEGTMHPIEENEVEPILLACKKYLKGYR